MIDEKKIQQLDVAFQRILVLPMSRGSFRQMQNAILFCVDGDREKATHLLEAILRGDMQPASGQPPLDPAMKKFIERYSISVGVARDIAERGEFLSLITSDIIGHPKLALFGNRIRRIDGKEFDFLSDVEATIHLMQHFSTRLLEMERIDKAKGVLAGLKEDLVHLKVNLEQLIALATD